MDCYGFFWIVVDCCFLFGGVLKSRVLDKDSVDQHNKKRMEGEEGRGKVGMSIWFWIDNVFILIMKYSDCIVVLNCYVCWMGL